MLFPEIARPLLMLHLYTTGLQMEFSVDVPNTVRLLPMVTPQHDFDGKKLCLPVLP